MTSWLGSPGKTFKDKLERGKRWGVSAGGDIKKAPNGKL